MDNNQPKSDQDKTNADAPQSTEPAQPVSPSPDKTKKSKKPLIVGAIIAAAIVVLGGGGALAYNLLYQNPDKVLSDSLSSLVSSDSLSGDGTVTVDMDDNTSTINISNKMLDGQFSLAADANIESEYATLNIAGNAVYDQDGTLYIKVDNASDFLDAIIEAEIADSDDTMSAEEQAMAAGMMQSIFQPIVESVDGQWIKIVPEEVDEGDVASDQITCASDTVNLLTEDQEARDELVAAYNDHRFLVPDEKLGAEDGNLGFTYNLDQAIAEDFGEAVAETQIGEKIADCNESENGSADASTDDSTSDSASGVDNIKLEIWVDRWSHQLASMDLTATSTDDETISLNYTPNYDEDVTIDVPTDAITPDELTEQLGGMFNL